MDLLSLIFPKRCSGCSKIGAYLCPDCLNHFLPMTELYCPVCRRPSFNGETHPRCQTGDQIDGLISCYVYRGLIKRVIAKYKYKFVSDLHHTIVELCLAEIKSPILYQPSWTIIPVPLHPSRLRWRGFNQAELLARDLSHNWGFNFDDHLLIRTKATSPQMQLSKPHRLGNVQQAFRLTAKSVPKSILLIDDVATSCATLRECARVLKQAGAQQVWGLTLAQAQP